jgi:putative sterol carrier protein
MRGTLCRVAAAAALGSVVPGAASAQLMSATWAQSACEAWNADPVLTSQLVESGWTRNHAGRGFKVLQIYREDCADALRVELRIAERAGKARCVYGGAAQTVKPDAEADYVMYAATTRWQEMGRGEYGPMKAMLFSRLGFEGPMLEAMGNMGPFESFLLLVGKVPGGSACPAR